MSSRPDLAATLRAAATPERSPVGVVIVDHGSKRPESNDLLLRLVDEFKRSTGVEIVEPAHMELAAPSIADAFGNAVAAGARSIVVAPFFLAPGRHMQEDIPRLAAEAAALHQGVSHLVAAPMGVHAGLLDALAERIVESLREHC